MTVPDRDSYLRVTWQGLWQNLPAVALASLAFALLWAPAFLLWSAGRPLWAAGLGMLLVPAGWTVLLRYLDGVLNDGALPLREIPRAYARFWLRSEIIALPVVLNTAILLVLISLASAPPVAPSVWFALAAGISIAVIVALLSLNAFPLLALYDLGPADTFRNALVLSTHFRSASLGLLSMGVLFGLAVARLTVALLFFVPGIWGVFLVSHCRLAVTEELNKTS